MGKNYKPLKISKTISLERSMVDLVCSIMYAGAEDNENMIAEVEDLAKLLAKRDKVVIEPEKNRLLVALKHLRDHSPKAFKKIEHLND